MANNNEINIVVKMVDQASTTAKAVTKNVESMGDTIKGLAKSALAIYALKQGFDFLKDSISKASEEEKNLRTLQTVIENQGESWKKVEGRVTGYIRALERNTLYTDDKLLPAMRELINAGMNTEQAMKAMNTVTDLATAKGMDLASSANLIGRAYNGNTAKLKGFGIEADDINGIMGELNAKFGGSARKDMDTYAGKVKELETSWDNFQKTLGNFLTPSVISALKALDTLFGGKPSEFMPTKMAEELTNLNTKIAETSARMQELAKPASYMDGLVGKKARDELVFLNYLMKELNAEKQKILAKDNAPQIIDFTPTKKRSMTDEEGNAYIESLKKQYEATVQVRDQIDQVNMSSYDYELSMIDQQAEAYMALGVSQVDIANWVSSQKIQAMNKEYGLQDKLNTAIEVMAIGTAEQQKYLIADILEAEMLAQAKKMAWMAVEKLLIGDFAGSAIAAAQALALGFGASVIHSETEKDKAKNKAEADARQKALDEAEQQKADDYNNSYEAYVANRKEGETQDQYKARYDSENGITTGGSGGGGGSSAPTSVERSSAPQYYYISNSYNLNAGAVLGDEFNINQAFKLLMEKYDAQTTLVRNS